MKMMKKSFLALICAMLAVMVFATTVCAAGGETNVEIFVDETEIKVGETVSVAFSNKDMKVKGFSGGFYFDNDLLECVSIVAGDSEYPDEYALLKANNRYQDLTAISSLEQANENGTVGCAYIGTSDVEYKAYTVFIATFRAKAVGEALFTLYEETNGTDSFDSDSIETLSVTIMPASDCSEEDPHVIEQLPYSETFEVDEDHYYTWTAAQDGEITFVSSEKNGVADIDIIVFNEEGEEIGQSTPNSSLTLEVKAGDVLLLNVYELSQNGGTWSATFTEAACKHTNTTKVDNGDGTHKVVCADSACGAVVTEKEAHVYDEVTHVCACTAVEKFEISWLVGGEKYDSATVEFGSVIALPEEAPTKDGYRFKGWEGYTEGMTVSGTAAFEAKFAKLYEVSYSLGISGGYVGYFEEGETIDYTNLPAKETFDIVSAEQVVRVEKWVTVDGADMPEVMPAENVCLELLFSVNGWVSLSYEEQTIGYLYMLNNEEITETGWYQLPVDHTDLEGDKAWYYLEYSEAYDAALRVSGIVRAPYNSEAGYNADKETVDYCAQKGTEFIDAETALFVFAEDGKLQTALTGFVTYKDVTRYVKNGMIVWNPGFVEVEGELYYFIGDEVAGGNKPADGLTYIIRLNGAEGFVKGDAVIFADGQPDAESTGVIDGYYFENAKLVPGKGLVKIGDNYYYVRSAGNVAVGYYWITNTNDTGVIAKEYNFDENGVMQNPEFIKENADGIVDGYYYVDGEIAYGAGLVELEDGSIIYVRSNGKLAIGEYWPTTRNGLLPEGVYNFGADGKLVVE